MGKSSKTPTGRSRLEAQVGQQCGPVWLKVICQVCVIAWSSYRRRPRGSAHGPIPCVARCACQVNRTPQGLPLGGYHRAHSKSVGGGGHRRGGAPPLTSSNWSLQGGPLRRSGTCGLHLPSRYYTGLRPPRTSILPVSWLGGTRGTKVSADDPSYCFFSKLDARRPISANVASAQ